MNTHNQLENGIKVSIFQKNNGKLKDFIHIILLIIYIIQIIGLLFLKSDFKSLIHKNLLLTQEGASYRLKPTPENYAMLSPKIPHTLIQGTIQDTRLVLDYITQVTEDNNLKILVDKDLLSIIQTYKHSNLETFNKNYYDMSVKCFSPDRIINNVMASCIFHKYIHSNISTLMSEEKIVINEKMTTITNNIVNTP